MSTETIDRSMRPRRRAGASALPALARGTERGTYGLFLQFGGQSNAYLHELTSAWAGFPEARSLIDRLSDTLTQELRAPAFAQSGLYAHGIDPRPWFEGPPPPETYLQSSPISQPMLFLAQAANTQVLFRHGYDQDFLLRHAKGTTGHSQGIMPAVLLAMGREDEAFIDAASQVARWFLWQGLRMQEAYPVAALSPRLVERSERSGGGRHPASMAAIGGLERHELEAILAPLNRTLPERRRIAISLQNAWDRFVVSAPTESIVLLQEELTKRQQRAQEKKEVPFRFSWDYLKTSAPFHSPFLQAAKEVFRQDGERLSLRFDARELRIPVFSPHDGTDLRSAVDLTRELIELQFTRAVDWPKAVAGASAARGVTHVIDLGAGDIAARLTAACRAGDGVRVLSFSTPEGRELLFTHDPTPIAPLRRWASLAPRLCRLPKRPGGDEPSLALDNRYTRWTKCWPIFGGGMTPTTAEGEIVAAAANAGFIVELAGGGQPTEEIFRRRLDELVAKLEPGRGIVVNTMWLDPYLWNLHFPLILQLKKEGYPIIGVTISAGVPEKERAREILTALSAAGIWCNAFKPGTSRDIEAALAIARAHPEHTLLMQIEGGKAGGHHSWEDLRRLVLDHYAQIRGCDNVILCAGGGIWNPEIASAWLLGTWHGIAELPSMPVDAVFVGTRFMACRESKASSQVKELLVATKGSPGWVGRGASEGGITSGISPLGADLFLIDNAAARLAKRLEGVSGMKEEEVERIRPELIAALERSAKPFFGDLAAMTYAEVLSRMAELMAPGDIAEHIPHDGRWYDRSYRTRFFEFAQRSEERFASDGEERIVHDPAQADDPEEFVALLLNRFPAMREARLHPEDVDSCLLLCRRPGKPVNFVPAIDREVRRWFMADSLWQSHDARYRADAIFIVPGPASVRGIERADEPVAEILRGFADGCIRPLAEATDGGEIPEVESLGEERSGELPAEIDPAIAAAFSSRFLLEGDALVKNPIAGWYRASQPEELDWRRDATGTVHEVSHRDGWSLASKGGMLHLTLPHALPQGKGASLRYAFSYAPDRALCPLGIAADERNRAILDCYRSVWTPDGRRTKARAPLRMKVDGATIARYAAAIGEECASVLHGDGRGHCVPTNQIFALAWPVIVRSLFEAAPDADLLRLVHLSNEFRAIRGPLVEGDEIEITAGGAAAETSAEGTRVDLTCDVARGGTRLLQIASSFLIRSRGSRRGGTEAPAGQKPPPSPPDEEVALPTPRTAFEAAFRAPASAERYAEASGDFNPIHTNARFAEFAGFDGPIIHGMWTAGRALSAAVASFADGSYARVRRSRFEFLKAVAPRTELTCRTIAVAHRSGGICYDITVADSQASAVAKGRLEIAAPRTAYLFTGQGSQKQGMGMDGYARSAAARQIWDEADAFCRRELGFSILAIVQNNPTALPVRGEELVHPAGVLNLTQFTQVALVVLAMAHVAELKEAGLHDDSALFAGHSLGEYAAIASEGFLPLPDVVRIVYQRGLTMQHFVPRDTAGRSPYRMIAVRPSAVELGHDELLEAVATIAKEGGALEVVNFNVRDEQYAVTGEIAELGELKAFLDRRGEERGATKRSYLELRGIDVPFHSRVLAAGVAAFRATLEASMPRGDDYLRMEGRYIPNLNAEVFSPSREYAESVLALTQSPVLKRMRGDASPDFRSPEAARALLIELLAYQFASPVQWIRTQDLLLAELGVERIVEIGPDAVLTNMARRTAERKGPAVRDVELLHIGLDRMKVFDEEAAEAPGPVEGLHPAASAEASRPAPAGSPAPAQAQTPAAATAPSSTPPAEDAPLSVASALKLLLALMTRRAVAEVADDGTIERLAGGNSAKRNEILAEIGSEFRIGQIENAQNLPLRDLARRIAEKSRYAGPGSFLRTALDRMAKEYLPLPISEIQGHLRREWALGEGRAKALLAFLPALARTGTSIDGGPLSPIGIEKKFAGRGEALAWIDACAAEYAKFEGIALAKAVASAGAAASVGAEALTSFEETHFGAGSPLANAAREIMRSCGIDPHAPHAIPDEEARRKQEALDLYRRELGEAFEAAARPRFDPERHVLFANALQWIRRDLVEAFHRERRGQEIAPAEWLALRRRIESAGDDRGLIAMCTFFAERMKGGANESRWQALLSPAKGVAAGTSEELRAFAAELLAERPNGRWLDAANATQREVVAAAIRDAAAGGFSFRGKKALVTGAGSGSIAEGIVKHLLADGATVVATTSQSDGERLLAFRRLYQSHASGGSKLHVLPASQGSRQDIERLLDWCAANDLLPHLLIPFGAAAQKLPLNLLGAGRSCTDLKVMLEGVENLIVGVAERLQKDGGERRCDCLLPLSPNCGIFGGDGVYAESKLALQALLHKRFSELDHWGRWVRLVGMSIGWTRGTNLMRGIDRVASLLEERSGVRTFSSEEMAWILTALCTPPLFEMAQQEKALVAIHGGIDRAGDLAALLREAAVPAEGPPSETQQRRVARRSSPSRFSFPRGCLEKQKTFVPDPAGIDDIVVVVGMGEVSPLGSHRTRWEIERDGRLSPDGAIELAWIMGLISYEAKDDRAGWVVAESGEPIDDREIPERFAEAFTHHIGIRPIERRLQQFDPTDLMVFADVVLEDELVFPVASEEEARPFLIRNSSLADIIHRDGGLAVRLKKGAAIKVPTSAALRRTIAGQIPTGWDPVRYGVPRDIAAEVDRNTQMSLVATAEAFASAGITPAELLEAIAPARIGNAQGSGLGGMQAHVNLYRAHREGAARKVDALQETLINVMGAWAVQAYVGSMGPMIHPVAACATAAVSLEVGADLIRSGKADVVVAGGSDDVSEEGFIGFGDMRATADGAQMERRGIPPRAMSRPNDRRRDGFIEAQGGGALLLARLSTAVELGLPIYAVVAFAATHADGFAASIPAPGLGLVGIAQESSGRDGRAPLAAALARFGLGPDDIAVVSKHDTSTKMNDVSESELHQRIAEGLGRTPGNPLLVHSQKSILGHGKGGAAAWQINAAIQILEDGVLPGNPNLEDCDPAMNRFPALAFTDRGIPLTDPKAVLITSLGFGHVGAAALLLRPRFALERIPEASCPDYARRLNERNARGMRWGWEAMMGKRPLFARGEAPAERRS